jgi:hypothetical protein
MNYIGHQSKMSSSKYIDQQRDFAAGVYASLQTGDTVGNVGIFDPALCPIAAPLTFSMVHTPPPLCE